MSITITSSVSSASSGGGNDVATQIKSISQQITKLTKQLKTVTESNGLTAEQKQEQEQLIQAQIKMLESQISQLQQQQVQKTTGTQETSVTNQVKDDGVNRPTYINQVDVYI